jgi:hypothetical protein
MVENVGTADEIMLVTTGFRHGAFFHDSVTILTAFLESESVT